MKASDDKQSQLSWFFKWFINNQGVTVLLITLLVFLNLWAFTQVSFIFTGVLDFLAVTSLPLIMSTVVYYLLKPVVGFFEKRGLSKIWAISLVFALVVILLVMAGASLFPMIESQLTAFVRNLPSYIRDVESQVTLLLKDQRLASLRPQLETLVNDLSGQAVSYAQTFSSQAVNWISNFASAIAKVTVALIISPFIIFYFLRDGQKMKESFVTYIPTRMRQSVTRVLSAINSQLSGYVQGQVTVAIIVGIMFAVFFTLIGLPYAVTLGIMAGILNMIPYLGSFLAMLPVLILGLVLGPVMLVKVILVFMVEQTIEGRFVTPLILGSKLSIHPITIMFILLTAGSMFGVWGVFLGIPVYASIKVVVKEIFNWYREASGLYGEEGEVHILNEQE